MVFHQVSKKCYIDSSVLKLTMPFAKLYFCCFSSGKDSIRRRGNSLSLTATAGEFCTCFLASISSLIKTELLTRIFFQAAAQIYRRNAARSRQSPDFLHYKFSTFEGQPDFLLLFRL